MSAFYLTPTHKRKEVRLNDFLLDMFNDTSLIGPWSSNEAARVKETNDAWELSVDLPGFKESEVTVTYEDDAVYITAKSEDEARREKSFRYSIKGIDVAGSLGVLAQGVLTLTLKKSDQAKRQTINISSKR